jgi:hypothetical protein
MAKGLLLAMMPKKSDDSEHELDDEEEDDLPSSSDYGAELAEILGVDEGDRKDFTTALKAFVKSCGRSKSED